MKCGNSSSNWWKYILSAYVPTYRVLLNSVLLYMVFGTCTYDYCLCFKMSSLEVLSMDLAVAVFPLLLMLFSCFAAFFYLSNIKLFSICFDILTPVL